MILAAKTWIQLSLQGQNSKRVRSERNLELWKGNLVAKNALSDMMKIVSGIEIVFYHRFFVSPIYYVDSLSSNRKPADLANHSVQIQFFLGKCEKRE